VAGSYLHGLFDLPEACNALLNWAGYSQKQAVDFNALREAGINRIADSWAEQADFAKLDTALSGFYSASINASLSGGKTP
jgi:adenosylcobyric acid synthase